MDYLSVSPDSSSLLVVPPPRRASNTSVSGPIEPSPDRLELSAESLDDRQMRDAILMKIALEGKDFHTARREVMAERAASQDGTASGTPSLPRATPSPQGQDLELTAVRAVHVEAELATPGETLRVEATRVEVVHLSVTSRRTAQKQDPLLLDMDGSGVQTTGSAGARAFDLAGDGQVLPTSFVQGNSAFLALDRNGDGRIGSGKELFGDQHGAADGYEELRKFDADANGLIDAADPVFADLQLLYGSGSLVPVAAAGIRAITLDAHAAGRTTASGDDILRASTAEMADGRHVQTYAMALQTFDVSA